MDAHDVDGLARWLAGNTRRGVLRTVLAGGAAAALSLYEPKRFQTLDVDAKRRKRRKKKGSAVDTPPSDLCPTGEVDCHGACVQELAQCPDGVDCPRHQVCRGTCQCADRPCTVDGDCFDGINPYACRNGCCCFSGPGGTYITGANGCNNPFCCSLRTGAPDPDTGDAQCLPEE